ncbi:MAG: LLM class flavin-dependent oxidoreductase [Thermoplasmata archaeon]|nr:LLM class flavin-dependent oxidoreductase [Thermoplasmata archaeon]
MRLSVFSVVDEYADPLAGSDGRLGEVVGLAEAAEAAGLHALWVAEHHFHPGGVCPVPAVLLAACGARTRRLRLGVLVSVLPFHAAVDVAEQYAMVDRLTGGRLQLGFGSGYLPVEMEGFGVDPQTKRERFDLRYDEVLAALRGEPISASGPGGPRVRLNVRPIQQPHPPVWIAVQRAEAIPFVARRGASLALVPYATVDGIDELAREIRDYRSHLPLGVSASVSVALHLYAGDAPDRARHALQRYIDTRLAARSTHLQAKVAEHPEHASAASVERQGFAHFGSARDIVAQLDAFRQIGVDEVLGLFDFGGLSPADANASVSALGARWA